MEYFNLYPGYETLSKYFKFDDSKEEFDLKHSEGFIVDLYWFDEQKVELVTSKVKQLLDDYKLSDHYDNLMYLCLTVLEKLIATIDHNYDESVRDDALTQLASTLLIYENAQDKAVDASFKTFNSSFKVTNQKLSLWIGKLLKQSVEQRQYPLNDLPFDTVNQLCDIKDGVAAISKEKLEVAAHRKQADTTRIEKQIVPDFCLFELLPYLNGETNLKKTDNVAFSDEQLTFLYQLLVATTFLQERHFDPEMDYEPKDYMRNYLIKYVRKVGIPVNPS